MVFLAIELCLTAVSIALAQIHPQLGDRWFRRIEGRFSEFAQKQFRAVIIVGLLALGLRVALLPQLPIPQPKVTDEFGYLLLADTFAHGRLANPSHPMWVHFETFHVNWHPTYASMYYPGYGVFLALGQVLLGQPFWGVWLSSGLMCAALAWALYGWLPPGWALLGSLVALIRLGTFSYWVDSYWGGTVTAFAGALVLGALPRIKQQLHVRHSLLLALGLALLAFTRPYEGLFFSVAVLGLLGCWLGGLKLPLRSGVVMRLAAPFAIVMLLAATGLAYYFWRVTGSPFTTPYQVNMRTYGLVYFPWDKIKPVEFHHEFMRMVYRGGAVSGWHAFARVHPFELQFLKAQVIWLFYFGPILSLPYLAWLFTRPKGAFWKSFPPRLRSLLMVCLATYASCMLTIYVGQPHYVAHLTVTFYAIMLLMMRDLYHDGGTSGRFLARSIPVVCLILLIARVAAPAFGLTPRPNWNRTWCSQDEENLERARILSQLTKTPGKHLVIVRYRPDHDFILNEWVFNNADIDGSKVVWARDMGVANAELLDYFKQRHAWLVEPDYNPARLSSYVE